MLQSHISKLHLDVTPVSSSSPSAPSWGKHKVWKSWWRDCFSAKALRQVESRRGGEMAGKSTPDECLKGNWGMEIYADSGLKSLRKKHHREYNPLPPTLSIVSGYQKLQPSTFNRHIPSWKRLYFCFNFIQLHQVLFQLQRSLYTSDKNLCVAKVLYKALPLPTSHSCFPFLFFFLFFPLHSPSHYSS